MRKSYSGKLKAKIAVEVIREQDTLAEISSKFEVHRVLLSRWKKEAIDGLPEIFSNESNKSNNNNQVLWREKILRK